MTNGKQVDEANVNNFVSEVIAQLKFEEVDRNALVKEIITLKKLGFSTKDAVTYCNCLDECNCTLEEKVSTAKMSRLRAKYR